MSNMSWLHIPASTDHKSWIYFQNAATENLPLVLQAAHIYIKAPVFSRIYWIMTIFLVYIGNFHHKINNLGHRSQTQENVQLWIYHQEVLLWTEGSCYPFFPSSHPRPSARRQYAFIRIYVLYIRKTVNGRKDRATKHI